MDRHNNDQIYLCPRCEVDTLHYLIIQSHDLVGIACSNCHTASLVKKERLSYQQLKWEDELRQILDNLENPHDD